MFPKNKNECHKLSTGYDLFYIWVVGMLIFMAVYDGQ